MQAKHEPRSYGNYIAGEVVPATGGQLERRNPANGGLVALVGVSTAQEVEGAIEAARSAFDEGLWPGSKPQDRAKSLRAIAEAVRAELDPLSLLLTLENGKPLADAKGELLNAAGVFDYYAAAARNIQGSIPRYNSSDVSLVVHEPVGVCALIVPWNSPISLLSWKLGAALAAGCTVVIKPSSLTTAITMEFILSVHRAEALPKGVINAVSGPGESVGAQLARSKSVDKVSFTGSTETGTRIMEMASANLKKVNLECGGKSTNIVFDDANMEAALQNAVWSIFRSAGQSCNAGSRLLVQETIYDSFMEKYLPMVRKIRIGDGLDPVTEVGPLISQAQLDRVLGYVRVGIEEGARLSLGGRRLTDQAHSAGFFVEPTVFEGVDRSMRIFQEEIFGPVLCVLPFRDEDEAISISNDTKFGLAGDLWSRSLPRIMKVSRGIRTGTVWVNRHLNPGPEVPFGGYKQSGLGRETGMEGLAEFLQTKHISLQLQDSGERVRR